MSEIITAFSEEFGFHWNWLMSASIKVTAWLLIAAAVLLLTRKASASLQHAVGVIAAAGVPLIFVLNLSPIPDQWGWRPFSFNSPPQIAEHHVVISATPDSAAAVPSPVSNPIDQSTMSAFPSINLRSSAVALWWLGCAIVCFRIVRRLRHTNHNPSFTSAPDRLNSILDREAKRANLTKTPTLLIGENAMPMTFGFWATYIVLPTEAIDWPTKKLTAILTHEITHIQRRDLWSTLLVEVALIPVWWHPLARLLRRRIEELTEQACDDAVISSGAVPTDYAADLLSLSGRFAFASNSGMSLPAMSGRGQIMRFRRLLDENASRRTLTLMRGLVVALTALSLLVPATLLTSCATVDSTQEGAAETALLPASHPEIAPVPQDAEQLSMQLKMFESDVPDGSALQLPGVADWLEGDRDFLTSDQGFQLFHPDKAGVDILSCPRVISRPGMNTQIRVGQRIPIPTNPHEANLKWEEVGISIETKIWATADPKTVRMEMEPSVAELVGYETDASGLEIPQVRRLSRKIEGEFSNGCYVLLGMKEDVQSIKDKVPFLGDIPVLGSLFRSETTQTDSKVIAVQIIVSEHVEE